MYSCIIVAAGLGMRSESDKPKLLNKINDKPIYLYSVELFQRLGFEVILVINEDLEIPGVKIVKGGKTRSESVYNGILAASNEYVFIHDGARLLVSEEMIAKLIIEMPLLHKLSFGENVRGIFLAKHIYNSLKKLENNELETLDRTNYLEAETPQVFKKDLLLEAFSKATKPYQDEVSLVKEVLGYSSKPIFHKGLNLKYTTKEDLEVIKALINSRDYRIGHSYDIHELVEGRKLFLGGIEIDYPKGLKAHSDGDVVLHAVTESILGAIAAGDLGDNYPPSDLKYKDVSSVKLLEDGLLKMKDKNYKIENIDILIYAEEPKLANFKDKIRLNLSRLLGVGEAQVSLKATTTEKIGPIGNKKAIACEAVVLLRRR